jgi:hypothetical protein
VRTAQGKDRVHALVVVKIAFDKTGDKLLTGWIVVAIQRERTSKLRRVGGGLTSLTCGGALKLDESPHDWGNRVGRHKNAYFNDAAIRM